ncbi:MAG: MoaD/ThiS family protein [Rhodospirillales bacterium]|nr:MoaD/ThiS family protein [Rhodospirillales bacterium]
MTAEMFGHNSQNLTMQIEVRLFNSLTRFGGGAGSCRTLTLPVGSRIEDVLKTLGIPERDVFLVLVNGRDVTRTLLSKVNTERTVDDGDVVALSGPVPFSWGYGAPVV